MNVKRAIPYFTLLCVILATTLLVWLPFLIRSENWIGLHIPDSNFSYIYKHFDGPLYIIPAKTVYGLKEFDTINRDSVLPRDGRYFAAHLPLYPILIGLFAPFVGYLKSMIGITLLFSTLLGLAFFYIVKRFKLTHHPVLLTVVFMMFPRFLVVRSVGAPETLFLFLLLTSLYFFEKKNYVLSGLLGGLASATKTPGLLLFLAYICAFLEEFSKTRKAKISWIGIIIVPLGFVGVCLLYYFRMGDFFAYFNSGDNIHLVFPFSVFNFQKNWVGTAWLEDILWYFAFYGLAVYQLKSSTYKSFFYFALIFFTATLFVQHRDISRYSLPLLPLSVIAFESFFTSKQFRIIFGILLFGIFMYTWNFLIYNIMPISEWLPFL